MTTTYSTNFLMKLIALLRLTNDPELLNRSNTICHKTLYCEEIRCENCPVSAGFDHSLHLLEILSNEIRDPAAD